MSTPEAVDPLAQLAAEEAADMQAAEAAVSPPSADNEPQAPEDAAPAEEQPEWQQRGFRSAEDMWKSYQNLEAKFRERDNEIGELRKFQRQVEAQMQAQQQPQGAHAFPDGTPIYDAQTIQSAVDEGTITELQASMIWSEQAARLQAMELEQRMQQQFQPIRDSYVNLGAQSTLDGLNAAVGDDVVARHAPLVAQLLEQDREHYAHPQHGVRRLTEAVKSAEFDYQHGGGQQAQPRNQDGTFAPRDVIVEGGSGAQGPVTPGATRLDPEEQQLIQSLIPQKAMDEAGIPIPWAR